MSASAAASEQTMQCPACGDAVPAGDAFCENCGQRLAAAPGSARTAAAGSADAGLPATCLCGAPVSAADEEGFCTQCGRRVVRPASDHIEEPVTTEFAAVSDRGIRHDRNEDRFAVGRAAGSPAMPGADGYALVVCDGVSSSHQSEQASGAVSQAVCAALLESLRAGGGRDTALMQAAIAAGAKSVAAAPGSGAAAGDNPPSTTVVAACVRSGVATIGWVGDSRAYWITRDTARPLTRDHSWMNAVVSAGEMSAEAAAKAPQAHAITRWLGADAEEEAEPEVVQMALAGEGMLLLCTDGLWNYAPTPEEMHKVAADAGAFGGSDMLGVARRLVEFANGRGGQDNITVALLRWRGMAESTMAGN